MLPSESVRVLMFLLVRDRSPSPSGPIVVELIEPSFSFPSFPAELPDVLLGVWLATPQPFAGRIVRYSIAIIDADGRRLDGGLFLEGTFEMRPPGPDYRVGEYDHSRFLINLEGKVIESPGAVIFSLEMEGRELASLPVVIERGDR